MEKSRAIDLLDNLIGMIEDNQDNDYDTAFRMAIEALKAQLSKEGTTSDLISRTETVKRLRGVIDVTVPITDYDGGYVDGVEVGISMVSTMPTIQPVATDTNVGNNSEIPNSSGAVSRQEAIDALDCINGAEEVLRSLPSAQPERADGEWSDGYRWQRCSLCKQTGKKSWNYCPNCGAKMTISTK